MSHCDNAHRLAKADALLAAMVRDLCLAVNTPRSLCVWLLFSNNEHCQLIDLTIDPSEYFDPASFADDYLVTKFLSKYPFLNTGIDTKEKALSAFFEAEAACKQTNRRLRSSNPERAHFSIIRNARKIIAEVLDGDEFANSYSPGTIADIVQHIGWGPGVTSSTKGNNLSSYHKLQSDLDLTAELSDLPIRLFTGGVTCWSNDHGEPQPLRVVAGNRVTFVPKNAKTDRPIAVEPHLNALFQKGVGWFIRKRLRQVLKVNLQSQSKNQDLAKLGSFDGSFATIDLKAASDTVSKGVVELLFPSHWVTLFDAVRSQRYSLDGSTWCLYEKHSSMGNGYTFELESLIFAALTKAVLDYAKCSNTTFSVYGDDIVAPTEISQLLIEVLEYAGFTTNKEKTFTSGPFRESCGKDFFNGVNVRPFFIKRKIDTVDSLFQLVNAVRRYSHMRASCMGCDARFFRTWRNLFQGIPAKFRGIRGPEGYGDNWIIGNFDECSQSISSKWSRDLQRIEFRLSALSFKALRIPKENGRYSVASALFDSRNKSGSNCDLDLTVFSPAKRGRWTVNRTTVLQWYDCGAWL